MDRFFVTATLMLIMTVFFGANAYQAQGYPAAATVVAPAPFAAAFSCGASPVSGRLDLWVRFLDERSMAAAERTVKIYEGLKAFISETSVSIENQRKIQVSG